MEDFSAHSNYCELALRELGFRTVFPHCGAQAEINVQGKRLFPVVTGSFGAVDFLHSVIGEANDHLTQSEVDEIDVALKNAEAGTSGGGPSRSRGLLDDSGSTDFISLVSRLPDVGTGFANQARSRAGENANVVPGMSPNFDPVKVAGQIYPILQFRDKIVKAISRGISMIPGLEKLIEHISETLTAFVLGLLAPFIRPVINQVSRTLKDGAAGIVSASSKSQLEPWEDAQCSDPTHSMLSKDHFTNILSGCAGRVSVTILQYTVPRVLFAWENSNVPVDEVVNDVLRAFHHPALRNETVEIQRDMFKTVRMWADEHPRRHELGQLLSSESVRMGKNHILNQKTREAGGSHGAGGHSHGSWESLGQLGHGKVAGSLWSQVRTRDLDSMEGRDGDASTNYVPNSPAPPSSQRPTQPNYDYGQNPPYQSGSGSMQPGPPGGYTGPPPQPGAYHSGYTGPPPGDQWGPPGPQGYGAPGPGYGAPSPQHPPYQPQGLPPPHPPPSWSSFPGQGRY